LALQDPYSFSPLSIEDPEKRYTECKKVLVNPHLYHLASLSLYLIEEEKKYNQQLAQFSDFIHGDSIVGKDYPLEYYTDDEREVVLTLRKRIHVSLSLQEKSDRVVYSDISLGAFKL
jgi:hypothetical protein